MTDTSKTNRPDGGHQGQADQDPTSSEEHTGSTRRGGGDQSERQQGASLAEKAVIVISVALTVALFAYAGWQMVTPAQSDAPQVSVAGTETMNDGSVAVSIQLRNPRDVGLISATVQSDCSSPPAEVQFSYVPAASTRTGTLVCPAGTSDPSVSLSNWVSR